MVNIKEFNFKNYIDVDGNFNFSAVNDIDEISTSWYTINPTIKKIKINSIVYALNSFYHNNTKYKLKNKIYTLFFNYDYNKITLYIIDRVIRIFKLYDEKNFEIVKTTDYYSERISGIYLKIGIAEKLNNELMNFFSYKNLESIFTNLLRLEYGYVLPSLLDKKVKIIKVEKNNIDYFNPYKKQLKYKPYYDSKKYHLFRGIIEKQGSNNYNLIDGYNRVVSCDKKSMEVILFK